MSSVSVIIPAYNCGRYLAAAVESVLSQTCPPMEIIVVDDGSTDDTPQVLERLSSSCREVGTTRRVVRFTALHQSNAGPAAARNTGAQAATGEWLAFLDADDEWLPWRLEVQLAQASKYPNIVMWCGELENTESNALSKKPTTPPPVQFLNLKDFAILNPVGTTSVLLRRLTFEKVGGFDPRFRGPEDYDLWIRIASVGSIGRILFPLARYREQSISLSMNDRRFLPEVLRVLDKAYAKGGVLHGFGMHRQAIASQYCDASWMAFAQHARMRAFRLVLCSLLIWPKPLHYRIVVKSCHRIRVAIRYLVGKQFSC